MKDETDVVAFEDYLTGICSFTHSTEVGRVSWQIRLGRVCRKMGSAPAQSHGVCGGSDSATCSRRPLRDLGVPEVRGTLGSMFDKITQPEHFELYMTVCELALQAAIIFVCYWFDSKPHGFLVLGIFLWPT